MALQLRIILVSTALAVAACGGEQSETASGDAARYTFSRAGDDVCIRDNQTGLLWQGKIDAVGQHDYRNTYSWYDPEEADGELDYRGLENGGACSGSACDTWHYVEAVNATGYCGHTDWRMPTRDELMSISLTGAGLDAPTIDTAFFRHTQLPEYWSGNDYMFQWNAAWAWNFEFGHDRVDWKKTPKYVRLVRSEAQELPEAQE